MSVLNLAEILKDCPKGTKLYSPIFGEVRFVGLSKEKSLDVIRVEPKMFYVTEFFTFDGRYSSFDGAECLLFPSKDNRDWSTFKVEKPKFDVSSLQPFDKVLVRDAADESWRATFFSHIERPADRNFYHTSTRDFLCCIPYNEETKHLIGTTKPAPEFYVTWEK